MHPYDDRSVPSTYGDCLAALTRCLLDIGCVPTQATYVKWCVNKPHPKSAVVLQQLGGSTGSWDHVKQAYEAARSPALDAFCVCQSLIGTLPTEPAYSDWALSASSMQAAQIIRALGGNNGNWDDVLKAMALHRRPYFDALARCERALKKSPILSRYRKWQRANKTATVESMLSALAGYGGNWTHVLAAFAIEREPYVAVLRRYEQDVDCAPSLLGYRSWSSVLPEAPNSCTLITRLAGYGANWTDALWAAGFTAEHLETRRREMSLTFSRESCAASVRACALELGHPPKASDYTKWRTEHLGEPSVLTVISHWDPQYPKRQHWDTCIKLIGLDPAQIPRERPRPIREGKFDETDCSEALWYVYEAIGEVPMSNAYDDFREFAAEDLPSSMTVVRHLDPGGPPKRWNAALTAAGFDPALKAAKSRAQREYWREKRCIAALRDFVTYYGEVRSALTYLYWAQGNAERPDLKTVLSCLTPNVTTNAFAQALLAADINHQIVDGRSNGSATPALPLTLPDREACISALRLYSLERKGKFFTFRGYNLWRETVANAPTVEEIIHVLAPGSLEWRVAYQTARKEFD